MQSKTFRASALATATVLLSTALQAGVIDNSNNTAGKLGACGVDGDPTACIGAWNLDNVDVQQVRADGTVFGSFDKLTGTYAAMAAGDSFVSAVKDALGSIMAKVSGKVWPVGEPTGIKAVNDDTDVKNGNPQNCLINTAYLSAADTGSISGYLDMPAPMPVICSSPFQTHKRFKIAMQPATVDGVAAGADGKPIDLVFNVKDEAGSALRPYQVFSKINNYTGKQLKGYKVVVGRTVGGVFQSATDLGITDRLQISLGIGEGPGGANLFDGDGLATFSHGLFGPVDQHFPAVGFFDERTAGFDVVQNCTAPCDSDTISSNGVLPSNYAGPATTPLTAPLFGEWLPSEWAPKGIFYDDDNDPSTDAELVAWWNGSAWVKNYASGFAPVSDTEFAQWKANSLYSIDTIEDVLNLGLNYIVKVGNNIDNDGDAMTDSTITIRIIPVVADAQVMPSYVGTTPTPLVDPAPAPAVNEGGGCSAATGERPVDPVLPLLAALGLIGWGLRRMRQR